MIEKINQFLKPRRILFLRLGLIFAGIFMSLFISECFAGKSIAFVDKLFAPIDDLTEGLVYFGVRAMYAITIVAIVTLPLLAWKQRAGVTATKAIVIIGICFVMSGIGYFVEYLLGGNTGGKAYAQKTVKKIRIK